MNDVIQPTRTPADSRMTQEGQQNAGGQRRVDDSGKPYFDSAPLSEYPRMMYRKTDVEQVQEHADAIEGLRDKPMVVNRFGGLLCDTIVAQNADEAEMLSADGWDISPQAAHGIVSGMAATTTSRDAVIAAQNDEIEQLRAQLAQAQTTDKPRGAYGAAVDERRGPGRPRKPVETVDSTAG